MDEVTAMPATTVYNMAGEAIEELELSEQVFGVTPNVAVLHQVVTAQLVNRRQGNASTKTRSEVSGGNKKPYKQKGTGRARQGSTRSPQFRHGGSVFGPKPHPYHHDVPKKMRRLAIRSALSDKVANEKLIVVKDLVLESPRTKDMLEFLDNLPVADKGKRVLMMLPRRDENIVLSTRNIPSAKVQHVSSINVVELLKHDCVIMPVKTVRWIEMVFGEGLSADEASHKILEELAAEEAVSAEEEASVDDESAAEVTGEEATDADDEVIADDEATASEEEE
ncbi:MAG TPA: 50S ribosomal protein L4 [Ktedonobacteraceae bacterium]|nr:50S ribosomal protein L4 [Ktedonobacteraceae bacterium]